MKYGIIDIGSNTIRCVVFDLFPDNHYEVVMNEREFAEILSFVENGTLSAAGISRLRHTIIKMKRLCDGVKCKEIFAFATASLRNAHNRQEVVRIIKKETGITIDLLEGCDEVYYDYLALQMGADVHSAVGFDLGGGSCQLFCYDDFGIQRSTSQPIGCLAMYNRFVKGLFPTGKQRDKIVNYVSDALRENIDFSGRQFDYIYGMGGTVRALSKVHRNMLGIDGETQGYRMSLQDIESLDRTIVKLGTQGIWMLNRLIPERLVTFMPGLIVIETLMRFVGVDNLVVVKNGVREGYLIENALHKGRDINEFRNTKQPLCQ